MIKRLWSSSSVAAPGPSLPSPTTSSYYLGIGVEKLAYRQQRCFFWTENSALNGQRTDHVVGSELDPARSGYDVILETLERRQNAVQLTSLLPLPRLEPRYIGLRRKIDVRAGRSAQEVVPVVEQNMVVDPHDFDAQHEREDELVLLKQTPDTGTYTRMHIGTHSRTHTPFYHPFCLSYSHICAERGC